MSGDSQHNQRTGEPQETPVRTARGTFAPGYSGNPKGQPKKAQIVRAHIDARGIELVEELFRIAFQGEHEADRIKAIALLTAYWIGKPRETVHVEHSTVDRVSDRLEALRQSEKGAHLLAVAEALAALPEQPKS